MSLLTVLYGVEDLSTRELQRLVSEGAVTVFDLNSQASWVAARVPGARPLDPRGFSADELGAAKDATLVFYCSNPLCRKAPNAARAAKRLGFTSVRVLSAGITGWMSDGMPCESGEPSNGQRNSSIA